MGLAAKNGILIVEFANQLRDQGRVFCEALLEGADVCLHPIVNTGSPPSRAPCYRFFSSAPPHPRTQSLSVPSR